VTNFFTILGFAFLALVGCDLSPRHEICFVPADAGYDDIDVDAGCEPYRREE
jgi:hypothetical protein